MIKRKKSSNPCVCISFEGVLAVHELARKEKISISDAYHKIVMGYVKRKIREIKIPSENIRKIQRILRTESG